MNNLQKSFWLMVISAFCGALIAVSVKSLSFHISIAVIFFATRVFLLIGAVPALITYRSALFEIKNWSAMMLMSICYVLAFYCYLYSFLSVPLALSSLLFNSAPLYVPIISFFVLKDNAIRSKILWLTMSISFMGVVLILLPSGKVHYSLTGLLLALLSGIFLATSQVLTKRTTQDTSPHCITFFQTIMSIMISFFPAMVITLHHGNDYLAGFFTMKNTALLVLCGIASWIYQLYRAKAMTYASVSFAMPFGYLGVVFVGILDLLLWGVIPDTLNIIGMVIVMVGVVLSLTLGSTEQTLLRRSSDQQRERKY